MCLNLKSSNHVQKKKILKKVRSGLTHIQKEATSILYIAYLCSLPSLRMINLNSKLASFLPLANHCSEDHTC